MELIVLHAWNHLKVWASVVCLVAVHMMNDVIAPDFATKSFLGDATMNIYPSFCFRISELLIPVMDPGFERL